MDINIRSKKRGKYPSHLRTSPVVWWIWNICWVLSIFVLKILIEEYDLDFISAFSYLEYQMFIGYQKLSLVVSQILSAKATHWKKAWCWKIEAEEKRDDEGEMTGYHELNGREFEQTGDSERLEEARLLQSRRDLPRNSDLT